MEFRTRRTYWLISALLIIAAGCIPVITHTTYPEGTVPNLSQTPIPFTTPTESPPRLEMNTTQVRSQDGMGMVYVPAGQFEMGANGTEPLHTVSLGAFWIDQTEMTNARFARFLNEHGNQAVDGVSYWEPGAGHRGIVYGHLKEQDGIFYPQTGYENHPVIEVSWYGAAAYCDWIGGRLPTEAEWEYAARGPKEWLYPWGNTFNGERVNYCDASCTQDWRDTTFDDGYAQWGPVGSYPHGKSWCGALDMSGNVWEWVSDRWSDDDYQRSASDIPQDPDTGTLRIARGGSWFEESGRVSGSERKGLTPSSSRMHWVGFRCVMPAQVNDM